LEAKGPQLPVPYSSGISRSRHAHMRELRIQHQGRPIASCTPSIHAAWQSYC
jgi:hypothetical protein